MQVPLISGQKGEKRPLHCPCPVIQYSMESIILSDCNNQKSTTPDLDRLHLVLDELR